MTALLTTPEISRMAGKTPAPMHGNKVRVQVLIDPSVHKRLVAQADAEGRTKSGMAAWLITQALGRRAK